MASAANPTIQCTLTATRRTSERRLNRIKTHKGVVGIIVLTKTVATSFLFSLVLVLHVCNFPCLNIWPNVCQVLY
ncbi:hypothetical protein BV898_04708 [Hypsibius exemplaris]|uniref:Uncharacterized protein n=1 Tax=Hypsibius exemplaris TaxID=2072580 RepID=A0A1W0X246_HYPEX|nr:hypothetical protein BV898_04708 [Hypsibius exemplaris]